MVGPLCGARGDLCPGSPPPQPRRPLWYTTPPAATPGPPPTGVRPRFAILALVQHNRSTTTFRVNRLKLNLNPGSTDPLVTPPPFRAPSATNTPTGNLSKESWGSTGSRTEDSTTPDHGAAAPAVVGPRPTPPQAQRPRPAPQTPAPQRLRHEVLPGLPLPAEQQHQARGACLRGHAVPPPPAARPPGHPAAPPPRRALRSDASTPRATPAQPRRGLSVGTSTAKRRGGAWLSGRPSPERRSPTGITWNGPAPPRA